MDVGPVSPGEFPTNLSDPRVSEDPDPEDRLPPRDYIGEEPRDLTPDPEADARRWQHERELYEEKNEDPGSAA